MTKWKLLGCAAIAALGAAACSSTNDNDRSAPPVAAASAAPAMAAPAPAPMPSPTPGVYTDAQLQSFVTASTEIDPINRSLATATPTQQAAAATQIREILTRNNLDGATYNAIATRAQSDTALAARIAALQTGQPQGETGDGPAPEPGSAPTPQ